MLILPFLSSMNNPFKAKVKSNHFPIWNSALLFLSVRVSSDGQGLALCDYTVISPIFLLTSHISNSILVKLVSLMYPEHNTQVSTSLH